MYKWQLLLYIILNAIAGASGIVNPYIVGGFIDQIMVAEDISFVPRYFAIYVTVNMAALLLGYICGRLYIRLQTQLGYSLNRDIIMRIQRMPINFTQRQDSAYLNQRINNDANSLIIFCINIISNILLNLLIFIIPLILLLTFSPSLTAVLFVVAIVYFVLYRIYKHVLYNANFALQESRSSFFSKLNEQLSRVQFIKLHGLFDDFILRLNKSFAGLLNNALRHQRASYVFNGLDRVVTIVAQLTMFLFGGIQIIAGNLTIGQFVIISIYFGMILGALRYLFSLGQTIQTNMVAYDRLLELVQVDTEQNGARLPLHIDNIEVKNISFSYGNERIIHNKNISFKKGNIYVIVGSNGTGKSTLMDIILGLQNGNFMGQVLYNGIDITDLNMYQVRNRLIGVSEQEPTLIADTLSYNLELGKEGLIQTKKKEVEKLADMLGLTTYINSQPENLETIINEHSANLSGGEKQKLSLLRALLKNPDVMILDEPTSALDVASNDALKRELQELKKRKIIIVVTHDRDFIGEDDVVIQMGD